MAKEIGIGIDLGSDTLKVVCAYNNAGEVVISKIVDSRYADVAIPAVAYFDQAESKWRFGYDIGRNNEISFSTVVKIKDLLSILKRWSGQTDEKNGDRKVISEEDFVKNKNYYENKHIFPLFNFPITNDRSDNYHEFCEDERQKNKRFFAANSTPQSVCKEYFEYVAELVTEFLGKNIGEYDAKYTLICPPKIGQAYIDEYERLVRGAFSLAPSVDVNVISSAKALGMMAMAYDSFGQQIDGNSEESALLFDIGEEWISVVKFNTSVFDGKRTFSIDGISGHNLPEKLGGNNIDRAMVNTVENLIQKRETVGSADYGQQGYVREDGLKAKNYLFMKSVKAAKMILGQENSESDYPYGVPVNVVRDLEIFKNITHEQFKDSIGIKQNGDVVQNKEAGKIVEYIVEELRKHKSINANVKKMYLSGGVVGTVGLVDAIKRAVRAENKQIVVKTFADSFSRGQHKGSFCSIENHEIYAYAPAVGGAQISLLDVGSDIETVLTRTYGTRFFLNGIANSAYFNILVNRGASLDFEKRDCSDGGTFVNIGGKEYKEFKSSIVILDGYSADMTIYSTFITENDIQNRIHEGEGSSNSKIKYFYCSGSKKITSVPANRRYTYLETPSHDDGSRQIEASALETLKSVLGFVAETGGDDTKVACYYMNNKVKFEEKEKVEIHAYVGVHIDREGVVHPYAENDKDENKKINKKYTVSYNLNGVKKKTMISLADIEVKFDNIGFIDSGVSAN